MSCPKREKIPINDKESHLKPVLRLHYAGEMQCNGRMRFGSRFACRLPVFAAEQNGSPLATRRAVDTPRANVDAFGQVPKLRSLAPALSEYRGTTSSTYSVDKIRRCRQTANTYVTYATGLSTVREVLNRIEIWNIQQGK